MLITQQCPAHALELVLATALRPSAIKNEIAHYDLDRLLVGR